MKTNRGFMPIIAIIALLVIAGGGYMGVKKGFINKKVSTEVAQNSLDKKTETSTSRCVNSKLGYEINLPTDYVPSKQGIGESVKTDCSDATSFHYVSWGKGFSINAVNSSNQAQNWIGRNWKSLEDYTNYHVSVGGTVIRRDTIGGENAVWFKGSEGTMLVAIYHNGSFYEIDVYMPEKEIQPILKSFKFTK